MSASPLLGVERGPSGRAHKDRGKAAAAVACETLWCGSADDVARLRLDNPISLLRGNEQVAFVCSWHCASRVALKQELAGGDT